MSNTIHPYRRAFLVMPLITSAAFAIAGKVFRNNPLAYRNVALPTIAITSITVLQAQKAKLAVQQETAKAEEIMATVRRERKAAADEVRQATAMKHQSMVFEAQVADFAAGTPLANRRPPVQQLRHLETDLAACSPIPGDVRTALRRKKEATVRKKLDYKEPPLPPDVIKDTGITHEIALSAIRNLPDPERNALLAGIKGRPVSDLPLLKEATVEAKNPIDENMRVAWCKVAILRKDQAFFEKMLKKDGIPYGTLVGGLPCVAAQHAHLLPLLTAWGSKPCLKAFFAKNWPVRDTFILSEGLPPAIIRGDMDCVKYLLTKLTVHNTNVQRARDLKWIDDKGVAQTQKTSPGTLARQCRKIQIAEVLDKWTRDARKRR